MGMRRQMCGSPTVKSPLFSTPGFLSTTEAEDGYASQRSRRGHAQYAHFDPKPQAQSYEETERLRRQEMQGTRRPQNFYKNHAETIKAERRRIQHEKQAYRSVHDRDQYEMRPRSACYSNHPRSSGRSAYGPPQHASHSTPGRNIYGGSPPREYGGGSRQGLQCRQQGSYDGRGRAEEHTRKTFDAMEAHLMAQQSSSVEQQRDRDEYPASTPQGAHGQGHTQDRRNFQGQGTTSREKQPSQYGSPAIQRYSDSRGQPSTRNRTRTQPATMAAHPQIDHEYEYGGYGDTVHF